MTSYALADHIFLCLNDEHLVFLDLRADRYWAFEAAPTAGLDSLVRGWPVARALDEEANPTSSDLMQAVKVLQDGSFIVESSQGGKAATPVSAIKPATELLPESNAPATAPLTGWFPFFGACAFTKLALRLTPFEKVVRYAKRRKEKLGPQPILDVERARRRVQAFLHYRLFLFSSKDECLYDSFSLIEFLARDRIYADWVFGVQARPFAAHCWVQHGDIVFNDTVEHVSGYTPIMVV